jgi:non-ribosomal peptide synthetase component F
VRKFEGTYEPVPLAKDVADAVKAFSQREGATPFMTMLAAFNALLARYSGQEHIVLGTDIANRTTAETERMIGFFINLLPVHTDLSGDPSFRELVSRVREVALGAYAHQDIPFDKLVEDLQPERSRSHNPIVQALFVMQNVPRQQRELPGLELSPFPVPLTRSKFDLAVFISDNGNEVTQNWVYSRTVERGKMEIMAAFQNLLRHAVHADTRLSAGNDRRRKAATRSRRTDETIAAQTDAVEPKAVNLARRTIGQELVKPGVEETLVFCLGWL